MYVDTNEEIKIQPSLEGMVLNRQVEGDQVTMHYNPDYLDGKTVVYEIAEGIKAYIHDFEPKVRGLDPDEKENTIRFNYCLSGRCECVYKNRVIYVGNRDFVMSEIKNAFDLHQFPLGRYIGYAIVTTISDLDRLLERFFPDSQVRTQALLSRMTLDNPFLMAQNNGKIHDLFMEIMKNNQVYQRERSAIKLAELILYILSDDIDLSDYENQYFSQSIINKIKHIKNYVTTDIEHYMKIEEICDRYDLSNKGFTECFKAVYGKTYYAFIKEFRMQKAAELLRSKKCKVSEVAIAVGYHNPSKFSKAFSDVMGISPLNYRRHFY